MEHIINGYDERGNGICCANQSNGLPCYAKAGANTDHEGYGFCARHDKPNMEVHPQYVIDGKNPDELPLYVQLLPFNFIKNWKKTSCETQVKLDDQIRLCEARIFVLLQRIKRVESIGKFIEVTSEEGHSDKLGQHNVTRERMYGIEETIVKLESEITKLQAVMLKAIDLRSKLDLLQVSEGDTGNIEKLVTAIRQSHTLVRSSESLGVVDDE